MGERLPGANPTPNPSLFTGRGRHEPEAEFLCKAVSTSDYPLGHCGDDRSARAA